MALATDSDAAARRAFVRGWLVDPPQPVRRMELRVVVRAEASSVVVGLLAKGARSRCRVEFALEPDDDGVWVPCSGSDWETEEIGAVLGSDPHAAAFVGVTKVVAALLTDAAAGGPDDPVVAVLAEWVPWMVLFGRRGTVGRAPLPDPTELVADMIIEISWLAQAALKDHLVPAGLVQRIGRAVASGQPWSGATKLLLARTEIPISDAETIAAAGGPADMAALLEHRPDASAAFISAAAAKALVGYPELAAVLAAHPRLPDELVERVAVVAVERGETQLLLGSVGSAPNEPGGQAESMPVTPQRWATVVDLVARTVGFTGDDAAAVEAVEALGWPGCGLTQLVHAAETDPKVGQTVTRAARWMAQATLRDVDRRGGWLQQCVLGYAVEVAAAATLGPVPVCEAVLDELISRTVLGAPRTPGAGRLSAGLLAVQGWTRPRHQQILAEQVAAREFTTPSRLDPFVLTDAEAVGKIVGAASGPWCTDGWRMATVRASLVGEAALVRAAAEVFGRANAANAAHHQLRIAALAVRLCQASTIAADPDWVPGEPDEVGDDEVRALRVEVRRRANLLLQRVEAELAAAPVVEVEQVQGTTVEWETRWVLATPKGTQLDLPVAARVEWNDSWHWDVAVGAQPKLEAWNLQGDFVLYQRPVTDA